MSGGVKKIILLTLGWEELPKSISVFGAPPEQRMREPVPGVLLETDGGWLLLDTGFNTALVRDPWLYKRYFPASTTGPSCPDRVSRSRKGWPRLASTSTTSTASHCRHLHHDHAGGLKLFAGRVPVHMQQREFDFGMAPGTTWRGTR